MRASRLLLLLALFLPPTRGWGEPPADPDPVVAAEAALRAFDGPDRAKVALEPSDGLGQADPWIVVDELLARTRRDVAAWVAGRVLDLPSAGQGVGVFRGPWRVEVRLRVDPASELARGGAQREACPKTWRSADL